MSKVMALCIIILYVNNNVAEPQNLSQSFAQLGELYASQDHGLPESLKHLLTLEVDDTITNHIKEGIRIHYNKDISEIINKKIKEKDVDGLFYTRLIKTKIQRDCDAYFTIDFTPGSSVDPGFIIYRNVHTKLKKIGNISGTEIIIPGDGHLYVSGHTNNMFNKLRKFGIEGDSIYEVHQPFYYVGLETVTIKDIHLYADMNSGDTIAYLPHGTNVTVLINRGDFYLIKTPLGLTGWITIDGSYNTPIKHIFYRGD